MLHAPLGLFSIWADFLSPKQQRFEDVYESPWQFWEKKLTQPPNAGKEQGGHISGEVKLERIYYSYLRSLWNGAQLKHIEAVFKYQISRGTLV